jgi:hypothetical protein
MNQAHFDEVLSPFTKLFFKETSGRLFSKLLFNNTGNHGRAVAVTSS